ncbi:MAG: electron transport complex subunit RsxB [Cellvibrionaceae bacterium]|nr:electron transport complex subunit RsxB [Cellvibrionaceae bacterium]
MLDFINQQALFSALLALGALAICFGAVLGFAAIKYKIEGDPLVAKIDELLPQTQCGQCGYPGCRPYAEAIVNGDAINKCPPGGQTTINSLANLLAVDAPSLDEEHGEVDEIKKVAFIREDECIGCTKCIQACPVDAILGAAKHMHTVIAAECTGCDLCVEPCPVDCIDMLPLQQGIDQWKWRKPSNLIASDHLPVSETSSSAAEDAA